MTSDYFCSEQQMKTAINNHFLGKLTQADKENVSIAAMVAQGRINNNEKSPIFSSTPFKVVIDWCVEMGLVDYKPNGWTTCLKDMLIP